MCVLSIKVNKFKSIYVYVYIYISVGFDLD